MRKNINEVEWKVRVDLAAMFRLTHMMGWDDTVWNHITARTPGTDHTFFMHQFGLVYEEVKASNLIKVDENGKVLEGPSKTFPFSSTLIRFDAVTSSYKSPKRCMKKV